jgi:hypothetical protein
MVWTGPIGRFMQDWDTPEIDIEGALSSGKTTACLHKELIALEKWPGIHSWIGRFGDGETQTKVKPAFEAILRENGFSVNWNSKELCYDFPNRSKCFSYGLKSPDALSRYSKVRGMGVSRIYLDQTEELPEDFSLELRLRLRQQGYPHQLTFSPNPQNVTHWLAAQFPIENTQAGRRHYAVSIHDNAHNLPDELLSAAVIAYPPDHAKYRSVIMGLRGVNVTGIPVYKGAFKRPLHVCLVEFVQELPLLVAIDFGKHHPCAVFAQRPYHGGMHALGGLLGKDLFLDDFLPIVKGVIADWFGECPNGIQVCCDPAGSHENSQGTRFNGVDIVRRFGFSPHWRDNANAPDVRAGAIESLAALMRRRIPNGEAFAVSSDPDHWQLVDQNGPKHEPFLADALEAGYVWDEHMVSVGNKQIRKPKKDGWFEHGMNALEYLELAFGADRMTDEAKRRQQAEKSRRPRYQLPSVRGTGMDFAG